MRAPRLLIVLIGIAMLAPLRTIGADTQPTTKPASLELEPFESKESGFAFNRPKGWDGMGPIGGMAIMYLRLGEGEDKAADTVTVLIVHSAEPTKLDDVVEQTLASLKYKFDDIKIVENNESTLGGKAAKSVVFTAKGLSDDVKISLVVCLSGQDVYSLMFQTVPRKYEQMAPTFEAIRESFKFIEKSK